MKQAITLLLLFCCHFTVFPQSASDDLLKSLDHSRLNTPGDQVFLNLDRNLYHPGDTIRFQAYIRDRSSGVFGSESISLYSLLVNRSSKIIDSARFRIVNATAAGWLRIPETASIGNYSVVAFTGMMMNYDPAFVFSVPVRIDKPNADKTGDPGKTGLPPVQVSSARQMVDLRFLPEGGTFIAGVSQRLAFNAVTSSGQTLEVSGEVINQEGVKITDFVSGEFGPGLVEFTPVKGDTYYGTLKGKAHTGMKWPLPVPDSSGIALRVSGDRVGMLDISLEGRGVGNKTWLLAVTMNNSLVFSGEVRADPQFRVSLNTGQLPAGTAFVTLYTPDLNPVAERLFFINDDKKMLVSINASQAEADSLDETELVLNTTDSHGENISSFVSVAVIDSLSGFCNTLPLSDIESTFLYDRDFYKNLPAFIRIYGLSNIGRQSIDLLLMTYGWRKFHPKDNLQTASVKKLVDYDNIRICNLNPARKGTTEVQILTVEDAGVIRLPVSKEKEAVLPFNMLNDSIRRIRIMADKSSTRNLYSARIVFPKNQDFIENAKHQYASLKPYDINTSVPGPVTYSDLNTISPQKIDFFSLPDSVVEIEEVIIKPKRMPAPPHAYINKYEKLYQSANIRTLTYKEFKAWPSFEYILQLFNPYFIDINNKRVYLSSRSYFGGALWPALFVLDDMPMGNTYEMIDVLPTSDIESVSVLKGTRGFTRYGNEANGGVVFVTTNNGFGNIQEEKNDDLLRSVRLFRTEVEYYVPAREENETRQGLQSHPTVLWMNEVYLDGKEPVKIRYPNSLAGGTTIILVNGVSFNGNIGSKSTRQRD